MQFKLCPVSFYARRAAVGGGWDFRVGVLALQMASDCGSHHGHQLQMEQREVAAFWGQSDLSFLSLLKKKKTSCFLPAQNHLDEKSDGDTGRPKIHSVD